MVIAGIVVFAFGTVLELFANQDGLQIILFFVAFIVGIVVTGVGRGLLLGFVFSILFAAVNTAVFSPETFKAATGDVSVALAIVMLVFLFPALIGGELNAIGARGFLGKRMSK